ncbi:MAG: sialate O-acetylesterase [Candidatus Hydrogenedentes bacterium]|nr:sialate O-acetylesterase [Candidatus Hydrogenedentota bacterium]
MSRNFHALTLAAVALGFALCAAARADLWMPSVFGSNMVLQQNQKNPIWGKGAPGTTLTISFAGEEQQVTVGQDGRWHAALKPVKASYAAHDLRVAHGAVSLYFDNILVGEVWVGSGQSNMQWSVQQSGNPEAEIAAANYPNIRLFHVTRKTADTPQEDCEGTWQVCTPETIPGFSAVAYYFGRELHTQLDVPVGLIHTSWGGTPSESWTSAETVAAVPAFAPITERWKKIVADWPQTQAAYDKQLAEWQAKKDRGEATDQDKPRPPMGPDHPHRISSLYNAMIHPIVPFGIKGAIWYQGESNAGRAYQYNTIFPAMIQDWRAKWDQGDFPFYFVQLANFYPRKEEPAPESPWAELRFAQFLTLNLPNTGMASAIDIGEAGDIHPKNKQEVGRRLALWALNKDYFQRGVTPSGPLYKSHEIKDGKVIIHFNYAEGLHARYGDEGGFTIAGEDQNFVWANAMIQGNTVVVSSPDVPDPKAVRYGWADNPVSTIYNAAGLPASPFRTDNWPWITAAAE